MLEIVEQAIDTERVEEMIFQRRLDYGEKSVLERSLDVRRYAVGEMIIGQGDVPQGLFFLKKGIVNMYVQSQSDSVCVGQLEEGAQIGDMAIFDGARASATVVAKQDCELYFMPRHTVIHLLTFKRDLARDIMMKTIRQLSGAIRHMNNFNSQAHQFIQEHVA